MCRFKVNYILKREQTVQENWKPHWKSMVLHVYTFRTAYQNMIIVATASLLTTIIVSHTNYKYASNWLQWCNSKPRIEFWKHLCSNYSLRSNKYVHRPSGGGGGFFHIEILNSNTKLIAFCVELLLSNCLCRSSWYNY